MADAPVFARKRPAGECCFIHWKKMATRLYGGFHMRNKFAALPLVILIILAIAMIVPVPAAGQATVSLLEQLNAQYKLVKMGADSHGPAVVEAGTILAIQKGGILGVPYGDTSILSTKYQDGTVHSPNALLSKGIGFGMKKFGKEQNTHLFPVGDKVYPSHIDVNVPKDSVTMSVVACDSCNKTDPTTFYKAQVVFQFAKGYLATAAAGAVEDTIGQLLSISDDSQQGQGGQADQGQQGGQQGGQEQAAAQPAAAPAPAEPQTIQLGQTTDEVQAALGPPQKIVNLGPKQIYVYKDLKVTFLKGKVTDVQ
jgi:hypothetical protein